MRIMRSEPSIGCINLCIDYEASNKKQILLCTNFLYNKFQFLLYVPLSVKLLEILMAENLRRHVRSSVTRHVKFACHITTIRSHVIYLLFNLVQHYNNIAILFPQPLLL